MADIYLCVGAILASLFMTGCDSNNTVLSIEAVGFGASETLTITRGDGTTRRMQYDLKHPVSPRFVYEYSSREEFMFNGNIVYNNTIIHEINVMVSTGKRVIYRYDKTTNTGMLIEVDARLFMFHNVQYNLSLIMIRN